MANHSVFFSLWMPRFLVERQIGETDPAVYIDCLFVYTCGVTKRLIDIDDTWLEVAQAELGTPTIKATVNEALRLAGGRREERVSYAFQTLADAPLLDRDEAWR